MFYSTNINKLAAEIEAAKKAAETRDLMESAKKKKKNPNEIESGGGEVNASFMLLCLHANLSVGLPSLFPKY